MSRLFWFCIVLVLSFGLGLFYGWVIDPVEYVDTHPQTLRDDFKTDYVLMVAEIYQDEGDLAAAAERLAFLGGDSTESTIDQAMFFAVQAGYPASDLGLLRNLRDAFQTEPAVEGDPSP